MESIKEQIKNLPEEAWRSLLSWVVSDERKRREDLSVAESAKAEIVRELIAEGKMEGPEAATEEEALSKEASIPGWVDPGTDHSKMYHYGNVVQKDGKRYVSRVNGLNHWEPGGEGVYANVWEEIYLQVEVEEAPEATEEVTETPAPAEFVQPTGAHDAYGKGDVVMFNEVKYESLVDGNSYSPSDYPPNWKKVD